MLPGVTCERQREKPLRTLALLFAMLVVVAVRLHLPLPVDSLAETVANWTAVFLFALIQLNILGLYKGEVIHAIVPWGVRGWSRWRVGTLATVDIVGTYRLGWGWSTVAYARPVDQQERNPEGRWEPAASLLAHIGQGAQSTERWVVATSALEVALVAEGTRLKRHALAEMARHCAELLPSRGFATAPFLPLGRWLDTARIAFPMPWSRPLCRHEWSHHFAADLPKLAEWCSLPTPWAMRVRARWLVAEGAWVWSSETRRPFGSTETVLVCLPGRPSQKPPPLGAARPDHQLERWLHERGLSSARALRTQEGRAVTIRGDRVSPSLLRECALELAARANEPPQGYRGESAMLIDDDEAEQAGVASEGATLPRAIDEAFDSIPALRSPSAGARERAR